MEFYIKKKYDQKVEEYFNVGKQSASDWRTSNINFILNYIPNFHEKERK
jgi:hypothetical protein